MLALVLRRELGLEVGNPGVLGFDHLALVTYPALPLLELDLELGQLRLPLVQGRAAVRELVPGADLALVRCSLLLELAAQRGLAHVRRLELGLEQIDVLGAPFPRTGRGDSFDLRRRRFGSVGPSALKLRAQAGAETLLGGCSVIVEYVGHRRLRSELENLH